MIVKNKKIKNEILHPYTLYTNFLCTVAILAQALSRPRDSIANLGLRIV